MDEKNHDKPFEKVRTIFIRGEEYWSTDREENNEYMSLSATGKPCIAI
jgi:hypothetical protein